jgi:tetratricopeptide (TPR) repeat protein
MNSSTRFRAYFNDGLRYRELGQLEKAEEAFNLADRIYPYSATLVNAMALVQLDMNKDVSAARNFQRAINLDPDMASTYSNLGLLVHKQGNLDSALTLFKMATQKHNPSIDLDKNKSRYLQQMGVIYESMGHLDSAEQAYRESVSAAPDYTPAYFQGAAFFARTEKYVSADSLYRLGTTIGEASATNLFNWGLTYLRRREFEPAIEKMFEVVRIDQTFYQAYHVIAAGYYENQMPSDSVRKYLDLTFKYNPQYQPALRLQQTLQSGER